MFAHLSAYLKMLKYKYRTQMYNTTYKEKGMFMKNFSFGKIASVILSIALVAGCSTRAPEASMESIVSNNNRNIFLSEDENYVFAADSNMIYSLSKADGSTGRIFSLTGDKNKYITAFETFGDRVYAVGSNNMLYSMAKDGTDIQSAPLPQEISIYMQDMPEDAALTVSGYTYDSSLYFVWGLSGEGDVWQVTPSPLGLTKAYSEITSRTVAPDGSVLVRKADFGRERARLYRQTEDGQAEITAEDEMIIINLVNFTEKYLFYPAFDKDIARLNVYKVSLDGSEKTQLFTLPAEQFMTVYYDNEYVYLETTDGVMIFDKASGEQPGTWQADNGAYEIADGKRFYRTGYYIDIQSGEKASYWPQA